MTLIKHEAELATPYSTPEQTFSLLRNVIRAIEYQRDDGKMIQVGQAHSFRLGTVDWPHGDDGQPKPRLALLCQVEIDEETYRPLLVKLEEGGIQLYVGDLPIKWSVGA